MSETVSSPVGGIRHAILNDIEARIESQRPIHGFVIDSLARMHPADLAHDLNTTLTLVDGADETEFGQASPLHARESLMYHAGPTIIPFKNPLDITKKTKVHPLILREVGLFDVITTLVEQRFWLTDEDCDPTTRIVSEELVANKADTITVTQSIESLLYYQQQTTPDCVVEEGLLIDSASRLDAHSETPAEPEIIVCIPVATGQERQTLLRTLQLLAEQSFDFNKYEIRLLHNTRLTEDQYEYLADTAKVAPDVQALQQEELEWLAEVYGTILSTYPELRINASFAVHAPYTTIGHCRMKICQDFARQYLQRNSKNDPLLLSMDADITSLNNDFLANMVKTAEATDAPVVSARIKFSDQAIDPHSTVSKLLRFDRHIRKVSARFMGTEPRMDTGTAIRLKQYCLAGGHHWKDMFSENLNLIETLDTVRHNNDLGSAIAMSTGSICGSHPRRQIDVMARGYPPTKTWHPEVTTFGEDDDTVRTQTLPLELAEKNANELLGEWVHDMIVQCLGDELSSEAVQNRKVALAQSLRILGLDVRLETTHENENE